MSIDAVTSLLRERLGLDPASLGNGVIEQAIAARQQALGRRDHAGYAAVVSADEREFQALAEEVTVPETWFFRGGIDLFAHLAARIRDASLAVRPQVPFRVLSAPCSSGEEAYSLAIALAEVGGSLHIADPKAMEVAASIARRALPLLEPGLAAWPDDVPAYEAKAIALRLQNRREEALQALERALQLAPDREFALARAARLAVELDQFPRAKTYLQRAIAVNPYDAGYHADLAGCFAVAREWPQVLQECRTAIELNPFRHEPRKLLVAAYLATGDRKAAKEEFDLLLGLKPPDADELRRWFAEQTK